MSMHHLLITQTYNYIYETESMPSVSFPIIHKVLSSHIIFINSDFNLKFTSTYIDCIIRNQSIFI